MAHEITFTNGRAEMAFVGRTPWHGLGQSVTQGASLETWALEAGMQWVADESPVLYQTAEGLRASTDRKVLYRNDTGAQLGVVGTDYKAVQPLQVLEFFRDLTEAGDWHIHTAGTLKGGRKLWAMASNHTEGEVQPGDRVKGNLLLATSLDGSMKTTAAMTAVRVVCANTLRLALADSRDMVQVSHRSEFDADAVKRSLGVARESFEEFMARARRLSECPIHLEEARETLRKLFGQPAILTPQQTAYSGGTIDGSDFAQLLARPHVPAPEMRENRNVPKVLELFAGAARGAEHESARGTRWGLFNAVTEHVDHTMGRSRDTGLDAAWFGRGHAIKAQALELLDPLAAANAA